MGEIKPGKEKISNRYVYNKDEARVECAQGSPD